MFVNPRNGWQNETAPVLFLGSLEKCRLQSGPARGVHSIFWTPVTQPQPTWRYQGPLLQASSGLGTQGGHRPGSLDPSARLARVLSGLGWADLAEDGAWRGGGPLQVRLGTASPGSRLLPPPPPPHPSQALGNISETSRSDAARFAVYLLPNAGIWEPAEREIRTKCGGGLDRNSGRSRSWTTGPLGSQEPDRCCGGKAVSQTPGWGEAGGGSRPGSLASPCPLPAAPALAPGLERSRSITTAWSDAASEAGGSRAPLRPAEAWASAGCPGSGPRSGWAG